MVDRRQFIKTAGAAGVAGMAGVSGCMGGGSGTTVSILTWTGYDDVNDQVEETLGDVTLDVSIADGSANMFSTVNAGGGEEYDIVIPNNEYVPRFIEADLAAPVDTDIVTNYDALYPTFQSAAEGQFADGGDVYGLPVQFGWYAYGYDTSVLPEDHEHSYDVLFSEEYEGVDLTGGITLYDGYYKSIMAAGLALGYTDAFEGDTVSFTDDQLTSIEETLIEFKPNLLGFVHDEETLTQDYQNGNVVVSYANRSTHVGIMNDVESVAFSQPAEEELTWFGRLHEQRGRLPRAERVPRPRHRRRALGDAKHHEHLTGRDGHDRDAVAPDRAGRPRRDDPVQTRSAGRRLDRDVRAGQERVIAI